VIKKLIEKLFGNEFDRLLAKARKNGGKRFLIFWNRGLGDIALGLYALIEKLREVVTDAEITVVTRQDLAQPFRLLRVHNVLVDDALKRSDGEAAKTSFTRLGIRLDEFDVVLARVNPTKWLTWQLGKVTPRLAWRPAFDGLSQRIEEIDEGTLCIGVHVDSETAHYYGYIKNWPPERWQALFSQLEIHYPLAKILLFGHQINHPYVFTNIVDLRGRTTCLEMLSTIKNQCHVLIAPDSGILTMAYYLDCDFPLLLISLWADPRQGILKQGVTSPNRQLQHVPLQGLEERIANIGVADVLSVLDEHLIKDMPNKGHGSKNTCSSEHQM